MAGGVQGVNAIDGSASYDELVSMLKRRELMPSDLVESGGLWRSFSEAPEFYEACEGLTDTRALGQHMRAILLGGAAFGFAALLILLRVLARH